MTTSVDFIDARNGSAAAMSSDNSASERLPGHFIGNYGPH
ncbi:hypothetical protein GGE07_005142 [Sinorhizobium terangae]|nr:hypothetical protein [Sinorhizobium terangae]